MLRVELNDSASKGFLICDCDRGRKRAANGCDLLRVKHSEADFNKVVAGCAKDSCVHTKGFVLWWRRQLPVDVDPSEAVFPLDALNVDFDFDVRSRPPVVPLGGGYYSVECDLGEEAPNADAAAAATATEENEESTGEGMGMPGKKESGKRKRQLKPGSGRNTRAPMRSALVHKYPGLRGVINTRVRRVECPFCPHVQAKERRQAGRKQVARSCKHIRALCKFESSGESEVWDEVFAPPETNDADDGKETHFELMDRVLQLLSSGKLLYSDAGAVQPEYHTSSAQQDVL